MRAGEFSRTDCRLGACRVRYERLRAEFRCDACGGRIVVKARPWRAECGRCGSTEFVHEHAYRQQCMDALEVLDGMPPEVAARFTERS